MTAIDTPRADPGWGAGSMASRVGSLVRGRADQPAWVRPSLVGVGLLAGVLYIWQLTASGYANTYYAMAAQAGSQSWSAWFFGSLDAANFITIDKPPASLWVNGLAVRLFGLNSWSILLPQALMGVATVLLLFAIVRRSFGPVAGLTAALVMATTPVAVLIFRYNNPDALLTLLLVAAAGTLLRGVENGRTRWLVAAGVLVGFGFLTKYLQAYQVLPALGLTYLVAGPGRASRRIGQLAVATGVVAVTSGWWVAVMELLPAASRPYVGGSTTNSVLDLIFGYDGLERIFGASGPGFGGFGGGGPGGGGGGFGGTAGFLRLFNEEWGGQIAWLLPFAITSLAGGLWVRRRALRTDPRRTGYLLWGGWLVVNGAVFSLMSGIAHPYYSVILAPAIGALVGAGVVDLWRWRARSLAGGVILGGAIAATGWLALLLLDRTPDFAPGLGIIAAFAATAAGILVAIPDTVSAGRGVAIAGLVVGAMSLTAGPLACDVATMATAHSGGTVAAGPGGGADSAGGGGGRSGFPAGGLLGFGGGFPAGGFGGPGFPGGGTAAAGGGGAGGASDALLAYLVENRGTATWLVAVSGSGSAASIQLATGQPVLTMGGFNGSDAAPTGEQLAALVRAGRLRYVLAGADPGGGFGGRQGSGGSARTSAFDWASASCAVVDSGSTGGATLYDCAPAGG